MMLIEKMVESSIIPTGPRSANNNNNNNNNSNNNNKSIVHLNALNSINNNNESDNEKLEEKETNGDSVHQIKDEDDEKKADLFQDYSGSVDQVRVEEDDDDDDYQDVEEEEEEEEAFDSLEDDTPSDDEEKEEIPETESSTLSTQQQQQQTQRGVLPDVLLNELHEILLSSSPRPPSAGEEDKEDQEEEEISDDEEDDDDFYGESSCSDTPSSSPVLLEAIPEEDEEQEEDEELEELEEEEEWDSDSTLTELSPGHARFPPLSDVSTQPPPPPSTPAELQHQPCSESSSLLLPGPNEPSSLPLEEEEEEQTEEKKKTNKEVVVTTFTATTTTKDDDTTTPTTEGCSSGDSLSAKKSVTFLEDCGATSAGQREKDNQFETCGESLQQSVVGVEQSGDLNSTDTDGPREILTDSITTSSSPKTQTVNSSIREKVKVQSARKSPNNKNKKSVTFQDCVPKGKSEEVCSTSRISKGGCKSVGSNSPFSATTAAGVVEEALSAATLNAPTASSSGPASEYFVVKLLAAEQQRQLDLVDLTRLTNNIEGGYTGGRELSKFIEAETVGSYFSDNNSSTCIISDTEGEMHQRLSSSCSEHQHLPPGIPREKPRSVLRKLGAAVKKSGRNVSFNESLNLFYEAECQCWIHEEDYARLRHEEQMQQQLIYEQATQLHQLHHHHHPHHHHGHAPYLTYDPPPLEFEDTPTLSPPEGYKDRFFPQMMEYQLQLQLQQQQHQQQQLQQQQQSNQDPDVTRVSPPSPPAARRKVFLKENSTEQQPLNNHTHQRDRAPMLNGLEEDEDEESRAKKSSLRFGRGILKGGRLWRSNSSEEGSKKIIKIVSSSSPTDEPDLVRCTNHNNHSNSGCAEGYEEERMMMMNVNPTQIHQQNQSQQVEMDDVVMHRPTQVSIGTAPLRTSEQIRLAVDSTLRISRSKKNSKQECSSLVEKLRWLTSLDDDDSSDSQSGFATWPSRDKNGVLAPSSNTPTSSSSRKSDAGTSTSEEFVHPNLALRLPISSNEAKIKQISYTLEDIDEGLKGGENELETFITEDGARIERIRRRYGEDVGGDDYGFSRRPSVKGIKPKFSSTNQIFAQFTRAGAETPIPQMQTMQLESQYENMRIPPPPPPVSSSIPSHYEALPPPEGGSGGGSSTGARVNLNYDQFPPSSNNSSGSGNGSSSQSGGGGAPGNGPPTQRSSEESRSHFEMIRQSFENQSFVNYNRPHSWSVSTLPHNHSHPNNNNNTTTTTTTTGHVIPLPGMANSNALSGSALNIQPNGAIPQQQQPQPQNNLSSASSMGIPLVGMNGATSMGGTRPNSMPMMGGPQQQQQMMYGTLPSQQSVIMAQQQGVAGQQIYGTVRRVPNVIGRPLFLHYGALSVEAHPNKLVQPYPPTKVPETPSPTQPQQPHPAPINNIKYYGPPIRYYNPPPPVPPRSATTTIGSGVNGAPSDCIGLERGNPEGATDEEPSIKEPYSMNV